MRYLPQQQSRQQCPLRIALLSPKGPLYRHGSGIFRKTLRAAPLTLTTLAALIPPKLQAEVKIYDEGIETLPRSFDVDLIGMTVITGSAPRAYELAREFRAQGITVVLGGMLSNKLSTVGIKISSICPEIYNMWM